MLYYTVFYLDHAGGCRVTVYLFDIVKVDKLYTVVTAGGSDALGDSLAKLGVDKPVYLGVGQSFF